MFIAFKMAYSCCFSLGVNLDFPEFLQKRFITSTTFFKRKRQRHQWQEQKTSLGFTLQFKTQDLSG